MIRQARPSRENDAAVTTSDASETVARLSGFYGEVMDTWSPAADAEPARRPRRRRRSQRTPARPREEPGRSVGTDLIYVIDCDLTALWESARELTDGAPGDRFDDRVARAALFAKATCAALRRAPTLNEVDDPAARDHRSYDDIRLGIAVTTPRGLMVPTIRNAPTADVRRLAREIADVVERCRRWPLDPAGLTPPTFTLDTYDLSGHGGDAPLVRASGTGILRVGATQQRPWVHEGDLATRRVARLRLVQDRRLGDQQVAGRFVAHLTELCENPAVLMRD